MYIEILNLSNEGNTAKYRICENGYFRHPFICNLKRKTNLLSLVRSDITCNLDKSTDHKECCEDCSVEEWICTYHNGGANDIYHTYNLPHRSSNCCLADSTSNHSYKVQYSQKPGSHLDNILGVIKIRNVSLAEQLYWYPLHIQSINQVHLVIIINTKNNKESNDWKNW